MFRIVEKPAFATIGKKVWIDGQDNELFGKFWDESNKNGLSDKLKSLSSPANQNVTGSYIFGISRVENNPDNRAFYFYIACESEAEDSELESYVVPAGKWAVFEGEGELPMSLVRAEMYAFMEWLPNSEYKHANLPELEVYPAVGAPVEFWLPIIEK